MPSTLRFRPGGFNERLGPTRRLDVSDWTAVRERKERRVQIAAVFGTRSETKAKVMVLVSSRIWMFVSF